MAPKILIIGATGVIGEAITEQVIASKSSFECVAILTSSETLNHKARAIKTLKRRGVEILVGDLGVEADVKKAYEGTSTCQYSTIAVNTT